MAEDARFEDAPFNDRPLRLRAETAEDIEILSALCQDAVGKTGDIKWLPRKRRLVVLLNRFRWEDHGAAERAARSFERVRTALTIENVVSLKALGVTPSDPELVFALLSLGWEPGQDGAGKLDITLAGDGALAVRVEALEATLADLTRPWQAGQAPDHGV